MVTRVEKLTIWIQFEINRPVAAIESLRFAFFWHRLTLFPPRISNRTLYKMLDEITYPDSKVLGTNMGPSRGRQDPGGPKIGPMNFAIYNWLT